MQPVVVMVGVHVLLVHQDHAEDVHQHALMDIVEHTKVVLEQQLLRVQDPMDVTLVPLQFPATRIRSTHPHQQHQPQYTSLEAQQNQTFRQVPRHLQQ